MGDLNTENTELSLSRLLEQYAKKNMKVKAFFKNPNRSTCIDLF